MRGIANNPRTRRSRSAKLRIIGTIETLVRSARLVVVLQYRGINGPKAQQVRRTVEQLGGRYHVVKRTLARIALGRRGLAALADHLAGPSALMVGDHPDRLLLGFRDFLAGAFRKPLHRKISGDSVRPGRRGESWMPYGSGFREGAFELAIRAAALDHHVLSAHELAILLSSGGLTGLRGQLLGALHAPVRFLGVLAAPARDFAAVLQSRSEH